MEFTSTSFAGDTDRAKVALEDGVLLAAHLRKSDVAQGVLARALVISGWLSLRGPGPGFGVLTEGQHAIY